MEFLLREKEEIEMASKGLRHGLSEGSKSRMAGGEGVRTEAAGDEVKKTS